MQKITKLHYKDYKKALLSNTEEKYISNLRTYLTSEVEEVNSDKADRIQDETKEIQLLDIYLNLYIHKALVKYATKERDNKILTHILSKNKKDATGLITDEDDAGCSALSYAIRADHKDTLDIFKKYAAKSKVINIDKSPLTYGELNEALHITNIETDALVGFLRSYYDGETLNELLGSLPDEID